MFVKQEVPQASTQKRKSLLSATLSQVEELRKEEEEREAEQR